MSDDAPRTAADVLDAAAALVAADDLDPIGAINTAVHDDPETRTGSPLTAEAKALLIASLPAEQLPEYPISAPESVLGYWADQVGQEEIAATMKRVAEQARTGAV